MVAGMLPKCDPDRLYVAVNVRHSGADGDEVAEAAKASTIALCVVKRMLLTVSSE